MAPVDPILGTVQAYNNDKDSRKINLGVGAYRTEEEKPYVFQIVKEVEKQITQEVQDNKLFKEYLPIEGHAGFRDLSKKLIFGKDNPRLNEIVTVQSLSGTGSLRVGFEFLKKFYPNLVHVPKPTWIPHHNIITNAGLRFAEYPYYNSKQKNLDFSSLLQYLNTLPSGAIVLLHSAAHNPTGVDPTQEQWMAIADIMKKKKLVPFFDSAYQGFASGDLEKDAFPIRHFASLGFQMLVAQSYAKNMGLYGERIGALHIVCHSQKTADKVLSQVKLIIRAMYSSPPLHGALIAHRILACPNNYQRWKEELSMVSQRILEMRSLLRNEVERLKTPGNWEHITNQIGMFSYTGLTTKQCEDLINKYHIYLLKNGRISLCGITKKNVLHLAESIKKVVDESK